MPPSRWGVGRKIGQARQTRSGTKVIRGSITESVRIMAEQQSRLYRILSEMRRRHVYRVLGAYAITLWAVLQIADVVLPALLVPEWVLTLMVFIGIASLPVVAILTWVYDITPDGVVRTRAPEHAETARRPRGQWVDLAILAALLAIVAFTLARSPLLQTEPARDPSIAVLPFADLSPEGNNSYFSDGISEAIIDSLAGIQGLRVASRTAAFGHRDQESGIQAIAENLGVANILEGSVRKAGNRLRVSARLVDGRRGHNLWSSTFEGDLDDVFAVQDQISRAIVDVLEVRLMGSDRLLEVTTRDSAAYDAYLRGLSRLRAERTRDNIDTAEEHFRAALAMDPEFGLARAGLCSAAWNRYELNRDASLVEDAIALCNRALREGGDRAVTHIALGRLYEGTGQPERAIAALRRALELEPNNSEAHAALATTLRRQGELESAESHIHSALELDPAYWRNYLELGRLRFSQGHLDEAVTELEQGLRLNPGSSELWTTLGGVHWYREDFLAAGEAYRRSIGQQPNSNAFSNAGTMYFYAGDYPQAEAMYRQAVALTPSDFQFHGYLGDAIDAQQDPQRNAAPHYERAIELARQRLEVNPADHGDRSLLAIYLAKTGRREAAREQLSILEALVSPPMEILRAMGETRYLLGDRDLALEYLSRAVGAGFPRAQLEAIPHMQELFDDPQYQALFPESGSGDRDPQRTQQRD